MEVSYQTVLLLQLQVEEAWAQAIYIVHNQETLALRLRKPRFSGANPWPSGALEVTLAQARANTGELVPEAARPLIRNFDSSPMRPGQGTPEISNLAEARYKIAKMNEEQAVTEANSKEDEAKIESLDFALKESEKDVDITRARNDTLEIEAIDREEKLNRFIRKRTRCQNLSPV